MKRFVSLTLALMLVCTLLPVTASADTGDKLVALTFDDGPSSKYTETLLDGLKELGAKCTFFQQGYLAEANLDIVQRAYDEGHEIANHTWSHQTLTGLGYSGVQSNLSKTNAVFDKACGEGTRYLLRPPGGAYNSTVCSAAGTPVIYWSVDTNDWRYNSYSHTYNHIINNASDGAIILCHDIHSSTTPAALDAIKTLQARGYEFVTVSELFRRKGETMENGTVYYRCNGSTVYDQVKAPVITYEPTEGGTKITMESPDGAPIYYCLDGSRLNQESKVYTEPFVTDCPVNIRAVAAYNMNGGRSEETTLKLDLIPTVKPTIDVADGVLLLNCKTLGADIHFTLDGSTPTASSPIDTDIVYVEPDTVIRAVAGGGNYEISESAILYYSENGNLFADVLPGQWFTDTIDELVTMGMMNGLGDHFFEPNSDTTRGMMVTLLYRYCGEALEEGVARTNPFTDVPDDEWYAEAVEWAYVNKVVDGYPDNTFKPTQSISRQEMAQMIAKFLTYRGNTLPAGDDCRPGFNDGESVAQWALDSVNAVVAAGLMKGDDEGKLEPENTATRAEFGTVLLRMMDLEEKMEQEREDAEQQPEPTEPADTTEPTDSTEPADTTEPTDSTEPADATEPTDSTEPADPIEPTDPIQPEA